MIPERIKRLISTERTTPPKRAVNTPAVRREVGGGRWAFCKTAAGTGSTLVCFLDQDTDGKEVTVNFTLLGGISNLSAGHLSLVDGTPIRVARRTVGGESQWWCTTPIEGTVEKECGA